MSGLWKNPSWMYWALVKFSIRKKPSHGSHGIDLDLFERSAEKNCDNKLQQFKHEASCRKHPCPFKLFVFLLFLWSQVLSTLKPVLLLMDKKSPGAMGEFFFPPTRREPHRWTKGTAHCRATKTFGFLFFEDGYPPLKLTLALTRKPLQKGKWCCHSPIFNRYDNFSED